MQSEKDKHDDDQRRTDQVLLRLLKTPPKPHDELSKKRQAKRKTPAKK
jgi:hypothetical protein